MIQAVIDSMNSIVELAAKKVSEQQLNQAVEAKQAAAQKQQAAAQQAASQPNPAGKSAIELSKQASADA